MLEPFEIKKLCKETGLKEATVRKVLRALHFEDAGEYGAVVLISRKLAEVLNDVMVFRGYPDHDLTIEYWARCAAAIDELAELVESDELLEKLAALEHEQWATWAKEMLNSKELLSEKRTRRWLKLIGPYSKLSQKEKEIDREWARKVLEILNLEV